MTKKRVRYARAGKEHKTKFINEVVELFDCHRKPAIRMHQVWPRTSVNCHGNDPGKIASPTRPLRKKSQTRIPYRQWG